MDIQQALLTEDNPTGTLNVNNLELEGMVLGWLVLAYVWHDLVFKHVGLFYDNTSAVSWEYNSSTSTSLLAGRILHLLSIWQRYWKTYSLIRQHI